MGTIKKTGRIEDSAKLIINNLARKMNFSLIIFNLLFMVVKGQEITIPTNDCRWLSADEYDYGKLLRCSGNEVAVGSCSGSRKDCPGNSVHQLKCCAMPEFSYSPHCERAESGAGIPIDCRDFFYDSIVKGQCHSGTSEDCEFQWGLIRYNVIECCEASYQGRNVGPATNQCAWDYAMQHGRQMECRRNTDVMVGRCGSGGAKDCPGDSSQGILCCPLIFL